MCPFCNVYTILPQSDSSDTVITYRDTCKSSSSDLQPQPWLFYSLDCERYIDYRDCTYALTRRRTLSQPVSPLSCLPETSVPRSKVNEFYQYRLQMELETHHEHFHVASFSSSSSPLLREEGTPDFGPFQSHSPHRLIRNYHTLSPIHPFQQR